MNLQECKDQVARNNGYNDYNEYNSSLLVTINGHDFNREVTMVYATEKVKEALKTAGDQLYTMYKEAGYTNTGDRARKLITEHEVEIVNQINKEK